MLVPIDRRPVVVCSISVHVYVRNGYVTYIFDVCETLHFYRIRTRRKEYQILYSDYTIGLKY